MGVLKESGEKQTVLSPVDHDRIPRFADGRGPDTAQFQDPQYTELIRAQERSRQMRERGELRLSPSRKTCEVL